MARLIKPFDDYVSFAGNEIDELVLILDIDRKLTNLTFCFYEFKAP